MRRPPGLHLVGAAFCPLVVQIIHKAFSAPFLLLRHEQKGLREVTVQDVAIHEACQIDGASPVYKFFTVTLPLLKPHITIALILRAIDAFRIFELPLILTGSATVPVISTFTYAEYSRQNYNLSAASATILTAIIMIFVFTYLFISEMEKS